VGGTGLDEIEFAHRLLRENEVAVVPGSAFGDAGKGHVRASFSTSYDQLQEAMERIARYLDALNLLAERDSSHIS
jgi:aminotransferase